MQIIRLGVKIWYIVITNPFKSSSLKVVSFENLKTETLNLLYVSYNRATRDSDGKEVLIKRTKPYQKNSHISLSIVVSVGKKSDPPRLSDRWSATNDIFCYSIKHTSHSLLFNFFASRKQDTQLFFLLFKGYHFYFPHVLSSSVDLFSFLEHCFRFIDHSNLEP